MDSIKLKVDVRIPPGAPKKAKFTIYGLCFFRMEGSALQMRFSTHG